jgi:glyoxylase-like metal-dependent hydrolase (beta-lactamase superfamily II)
MPPPASEYTHRFDSLQKLREKLPDQLPLFPGHGYGGRHSTVAKEKESGLLRPMTRAQWDRQMVR